MTGKCQALGGTVPGTFLLDWITETLETEKPGEVFHWNVCSIGRSGRPFRGLVYDEAEHFRLSDVQ